MGKACEVKGCVNPRAGSARLCRDHALKLCRVAGRHAALELDFDPEAWVRQQGSKIDVPDHVYKALVSAAEEGCWGDAES